MSNQELSEAFYLSCGPDQELAYQGWILQKYPNLRQHFTLNITPREPSVSMVRDESQT